MVDAVLRAGTTWSDPTLTRSGDNTMSEFRNSFVGRVGIRTVSPPVTSDALTTHRHPDLGVLGRDVGDGLTR